MLGTQPHQTHGSTFTHCVLHFNPIKGTFNIVNLGCVRIELIFAETENWNWKHCSKIIFKCVNSTVGPIFNKKVAEKCNLWDREQCTDALFTVDKVNYCGLNQKKKREREREKHKHKNNCNPNGHYMNIEMAHQYILVVTNAYLVARNEMFSRMNVKILIQWLHKT